jgi:uncharacterized membrane protein YkgB
MSYCTFWAGIAIVFLVANIYTAFITDKAAGKDVFYKTLSQEQVQHYEGIVKERRDIYLKGYILGIVLAAIFVFMMNKSKKSGMVGWSIGGLAGAIVLLTNYFFYILSHKSDYMVLHLDMESQREAWHNIYRTMQVRYHIGLLLGIASAVFLAKAVCS